MAKVESSNMYGNERYKFKDLGEYKLSIEKRVNELCEQTKKEYPEMDNYFIWIAAVDYVLKDELELDYMSTQETIYMILLLLKEITSHRVVSN